MHANGFLKQCARWVRHETSVEALPSQLQDWSRNVLVTLVEKNQTFKGNTFHKKYYFSSILLMKIAFPHIQPRSSASAFGTYYFGTIQEVNWETHPLCRQCRHDIAQCHAICTPTGV